MYHKLHWQFMAVAFFLALPLPMWSGNEASMTLVALYGTSSKLKQLVGVGCSCLTVV